MEKFYIEKIKNRYSQTTKNCLVRGRRVILVKGKRPLRWAPL